MTAASKIHKAGWGRSALDLLPNPSIEEYRYKFAMKLEPILVTKPRWGVVTVQITSHGRMRICYYTRNTGQMGTNIRLWHDEDLLLKSEIGAYRYKFYQTDSYGVVTKAWYPDISVQVMGIIISPPPDLPGRLQTVIYKYALEDYN